MPIMITGGTGYLGTELVRSLLHRGEEVVIFDTAPKEEAVADLKGNKKIVRGDLKVWPEVLNAVKESRADSIFHFGAMLGRSSEDNPWASFQVNVMGSVHVLEAARLFGVRQVTFASSKGTYGLGAKGTVTDETLQRPTGMYGTGKLYIELLGRFYRRKFGLDFRCIRYSTVMGPGVNSMTLTQYTSWMVKSAALGSPFRCIVAPEVTTPVIYYKDAIRAITMLHYAPDENIRTVCYNVSGVEPAPSAKKIETAIRELIPDAEISYHPEPLAMNFVKTLNIKKIDDSRARNEWDWKPEYGNLSKLVDNFIQEARKD